MKNPFKFLFLMLKNFPANFVLLFSVINLFVGIFSLKRYPTIEYYFLEINRNGYSFDGSHLFFEAGAIFEIIIAVFFLILAFILRNFEFKAINDIKVKIIKISITILFIATCCLCLYSQIRELLEIETEISNYCYRHVFCKEGIEKYPQTCDPQYNQVCQFNLPIKY